MGETAAETLREIEEARLRLTQDLDALESRLPDKDEATRTAAVAGGAVAGAGLGLFVLVTVVKRRRRRSRRREQARSQARDLARALEELRASDTEIEPLQSDGGSARRTFAVLAALAAVAAAVLQFVRNS